MAVKKVINDKEIYQLCINLEKSHWEYLQACAINSFGTEKYSISRAIRKIIEDHWDDRAKEKTVLEDAHS